MTLLDRDTIIDALTRLDRELGRRGHRAELLLVGGAVMCVVHQARDVDAWFTNPAEVRAAAEVVAGDLGLDADWLNDAAKAFLPDNPGYEAWRELTNLAVSTVDAGTLLAMKCAAARTEVDAGDIRFLAGHLGLDTSQAVLDVVTRYFPEERLPVRTRLLLEEMFGADH
jgi:hypothetical protein